MWASSPLLPSDLPAGSDDYLRNSTAAQDASFNISGQGIIAGPLSVGGVIDSAAGYNLNGQRMLSATFGNTNVGIQAGPAAPISSGNTLVGTQAGRVNGGSSNTFVGSFAGVANLTGGQNTFVGSGTGVSNTEATANSFVGYAAGQRITTGSYNSFFGAGAGSESVDGIFNSFVGVNAGAYSNGSENSFFGLFAGHDSTTGSRNTFVGVFAGQFNGVGNDNTYVGHQSGGPSCAGCDRNTLLGAAAHADDGVSNGTAIGANARVTRSNSVVIGAGANVGIGTTAPIEKLHVEGGNILVGSPGQGIILKSPDGAACRRLAIDDGGNLAVDPIACPG